MVQQANSLLLPESRAMVKNDDHIFHASMNPCRPKTSYLVNWLLERVKQVIRTSETVMSGV